MNSLFSPFRPSAAAPGDADGDSRPTAGSPQSRSPLHLHPDFMTSSSTDETSIKRTYSLNVSSKPISLELAEPSDETTTIVSRLESTSTTIEPTVAKPSVSPARIRDLVHSQQSPSPSLANGRHSADEADLDDERNGESPQPKDDGLALRKRAAKTPDEEEEELTTEPTKTKTNGTAQTADEDDVNKTPEMGSRTRQSRTVYSEPPESADPQSSSQVAENKVNGTGLTPSSSAPSTGPNPTNNIFEVSRLIKHRVHTNTSTVDFEVEWVGAGTSWESERELQMQVPKLVLDYWAEQKGGRDGATSLDQYHVLRILDQEGTGARRSYRVQWVGYRATAQDTTWEPRDLLERVAPTVLRDWDAARKAGTAKRGAAGTAGATRKKIRLNRSKDD